MVGWHHQLNGNEFEPTPGDSEGQGSLVCCSSWVHKESNMTSNWTTATILNKTYIESLCLKLQNADESNQRNKWKDILYIGLFHGLEDSK